jgi:hypothetical protein
MSAAPAGVVRRSLARRRAGLIALVVAALVVMVLLLWVPVAASEPHAGSQAGTPSNATAKAVPGAAATGFTAVTHAGGSVVVPGGRPGVLFFFSVECGSCGPGARALAQAQAGSAPANFVAVDIAPDQTDQSTKPTP